MLPAKFRVNRPFSSEEEAKKWFLRWLPWRPSWISDRENFSYFCSISHPNASYQVLESIGFLVKEKKRKIDFQDGRQEKKRKIVFQIGHQGGHLGFPIGMILAIFDLQITPSVESFGLSVQEKKRKIDFQDGGHGGHLGFFRSALF